MSRRFDSARGAVAGDGGDEGWQSVPQPSTPELCLLVSIAEAARLLSIGRSKVYELISDGELETVHIGRAARVPRVAVDDYVERLRNAS